MCVLVVVLIVSSFDVFRGCVGPGGSRYILVP